MKSSLPAVLCLVACGHDPGEVGVDAGTTVDAAPDPCATTVVPRPGTVITTTGPVTGSHDGGLYAWKGIPYAAPPTGDRRWQPPQAAACWTDERPASAFGPMCPQLDDTSQVVGDEACLTLNVWAPDGAAGLPVLVFVHGGGNLQGSASDPLYDGAQLAQHAGAVVVTLEYRLGALGFLANAGLDAERAEHVSGNYGILDQIAALAWVKANIAGFGGAADRVLLFGESAGAQDTLVHVASPLSKGLFAAALAESGGSYRTTLADGEIAMQAVVDAAGCGGTASVPACMRAVPAATLATIPAALGPLATGLRYTPVIDGYVLADTVPNLIAAGAHNQVPLVIGTNRDETSKMVPQVATDAQYEAAVAAMYGAGAPALLALYPAASYPTPQKALIRLTTDVTWTCPIRRLARAAAAHQTAPVYRYHFSWAAPGAAGAIIGATHGVELPFVFRTFSAAHGYTPTTSDLALADAVDGYWARFAATGDPNGAGALGWPRYDAATDPYVELAPAITTGDGLATSQCDAIDSISP